MPRHEDTIPFLHMLNHAREAVAMIAGKVSESLGKERMLELALIRLVEIIGEAAGRVSQAGQAKYTEIPRREVIAVCEIGLFMATTALTVEFYGIRSNSIFHHR